MPERLRRVAPYLIAASFYLVVAFVWSHPLALSPSDRVLVRESMRGNVVYRNDQHFTVSGAGRNARALLELEPRRLLDQGICWPTPMAAALGEHMVELGLLSLPGYAATRDPVFAYNVASLLHVLIAGLSAFALVRYWTHSMPAGLVAGLLFAFHPTRINDLVHPYAVGNHWMPLLLLCFERLLARARARDVAAFLAVAALHCATGAYPLLTALVFCVPFAAVRLVQLREQLDRRRLLALALAGGGAGLLAIAVLTPYALMSGRFFTARGGAYLQLAWGDLLPGEISSLGILAPLMALPLVFLRERGATPTPALLAGAVSCALVMAKGPLWPGGPELDTYGWLAERIELLAIVRSPGAARLGVFLALSLLAGLGLARLLRRLALRPKLEWALGAGLLAAVAVEFFAPRIGETIYTTSQRVAVVGEGIDEQVLEVYDALDRAGHDGPILDLPYEVGFTGLTRAQPFFVLAAGYHGRPVAACYHSHFPPSYYNVQRMASRLPDERGLEELAAAGLRNLVMHRWILPSVSSIRLSGRLHKTPGVEVVHRTDPASALRITLDVDVHHDAGMLRIVDLERASSDPESRESEFIDVVIENGGDSVFALPHPVDTHAMRLRWWPASDSDVAQAGPWLERRILLPLALSAGERDRIRVFVGAPPDGCECLPEVELPELGWRFRAQAPRRGPSPL